MLSDINPADLAFWSIMGLFGLALLWTAWGTYMDRKRHGGPSFKKIIRSMFMLD